MVPVFTQEDMVFINPHERTYEFFYRPDHRSSALRNTVSRDWTMHRIVDVIGTGLLLQGDANRAPTRWGAAFRLLGRSGFTGVVPTIGSQPR